MRIAPKIELDVCAGEDRVSDCSLDFGRVALSFTQPLDITIMNPSPLDLLITRYEFSDDSDPAFTLLDPKPETVRSEDGRRGEKLGVAYSPVAENESTATLRIYSDAANVPADEPVIVSLRGSGVNLGVPAIEVDPPSCDFGDVGLGATAYCDLSVVNRGTLDLELRNDGMEPGTPGIFERTSVLPLPVQLPTAAGLTIRVSATPEEIIEYDGAMFLETNDPAKTRVRIPLSCKGSTVPTAVARVLSVNGQAAPASAPQVSPLDDVVLTGVDSMVGRPGTSIASYTWTLLNRPVESTVELTSPERVETAFSFNSSGLERRGLDVAGTYVVQLEVEDSDGVKSTNSARVTLNAVPGEELHVQMVWDHNSADIDLHLIRNGGVAFSDDDCYFGNCKGAGGLDWGGGAANPHLDVDDMDGHGPENINIASPRDSIYRVAVHYWSPHSSVIPTNVGVKIFLRGGLRAEYIYELTSCNQYWDVADIEWPSTQITPVGSVNLIARGDCY